MRGFSLYARFLGASEIYAGITSGNAASIGVVRPIGFEHVEDVENRSRWRLSLVDDTPPPMIV